MKHSEPITPHPLFIRRKLEKAVYGISSSTIDRLIAQKLFPPRRRIGAGCVGTHYEEGKKAMEQLMFNCEEV